VKSFTNDDAGRRTSMDVDGVGVTSYTYDDALRLCLRLDPSTCAHGGTPRSPRQQPEGQPRNLAQRSLDSRACLSLALSRR